MLFAGAAVYINAEERPARMACGTELALGSLAAIAASLLVAGVLLASVIPFTLLVIFPTNKALHDPDAAHDLEQARHLLGRWNRLHAVRSFIGVAAFVALIVLLRRAVRKQRSSGASVPRPPRGRCGILGSRRSR